jgi:acetylornithine deacetylase/succinyl-diaminopimelate desuccinylase-like protein
MVAKHVHDDVRVHRAEKAKIVSRTRNDRGIGDRLARRVVDNAGGWLRRKHGPRVHIAGPDGLCNRNLERMHGNDERVPIESPVSGLKMITNTLLEVAGK